MPLLLCNFDSEHDIISETKGIQISNSIVLVVINMSDNVK